MSTPYKCPVCNGTGKVCQPRVLDVAGAALYLNVSKMSIHKWIKTEGLKHIRVGRSLKFLPEHLEEFMDDHTIPAKGETS